MNLAIHTQLTHAARNQLGVLRTEVQNQDAVRVDVRVGRASRGFGCRSWNARHRGLQDTR
jgi:hypothetical protein